MKVLSPAQCRVFLEAVQKDRLYPLFEVAISCGLRLGELLALSWEDVDFEKATISIRRAMQKVDNKNVLGEPKSEKACRKVAVPALMLRAQYERRAASLMFANRNGTRFVHRKMNRRFEKTLVKSGLPCIRLRDLRHMFASIMLALHVHPKAVQEALEH